MNNQFNNIITSEFKQIFNNAIDALLKDSALTRRCKLRYSNQFNTSLCNNCVFDSISRLSANIYNGTGPNPFAEGSICPVCMGMGSYNIDYIEDNVYLACIFDSKYWINKGANINLNIPNGMVQTLCRIELLSKIRAATDMVIDTSLIDSGNYIYEKAGDPEPVGFGNNSYIITMWKRK
jgi:hypothetical protein